MIVKSNVLPHLASTSHSSMFSSNISLRSSAAAAATFCSKDVLSWPQTHFSRSSAANFVFLSLPLNLSLSKAAACLCRFFRTGKWASSSIAGYPNKNYELEKAYPKKYILFYAMTSPNCFETFRNYQSFKIHKRRLYPFGFKYLCFCGISRMSS